MFGASRVRQSSAPNNFGMIIVSGDAFNSLDARTGASGRGALARKCQYQATDAIPVQETLTSARARGVWGFQAALATQFFILRPSLEEFATVGTWKKNERERVGRRLRGGSERPSQFPFFLLPCPQPAPLTFSFFPGHSRVLYFGTL